MYSCTCHGVMCVGEVMLERLLPLMAHQLPGVCSYNGNVRLYMHALEAPMSGCLLHTTCPCCCTTGHL
jgi:hypothetical protein